MLLKLSKRAKKVPGSGKVAILLVDNWFQQWQHSHSLCPAASPLLAPKGGRRWSPYASPQLVYFPSGSIASWCRLEQPSGFLSAAFPSLNRLKNLPMCGSILRIGMCDKRGGDPGWFVIVWKRLSLLWRVCIMSRINTSHWEICLVSRTTHLGKSKLTFYLNARRVFKVQSQSKQWKECRGGSHSRQVQAGWLVGCVLGSVPVLCSESQAGKVSRQVKDWMSLNMLEMWLLILNLSFSSALF